MREPEICGVKERSLCHENGAGIPDSQTWKFCSDSRRLVGHPSDGRKEWRECITSYFPLDFRLPVVQQTTIPSCFFYVIIGHFDRLRNGCRIFEVKGTRRQTRCKQQGCMGGDVTCMVQAVSSIICVLYSLVNNSVRV
jgi:hypothetical protein